MINDPIEMKFHDEKELREVPELPEPSLRGNRRSICLLFFLYFLEGIPLGFAGSIPLILQSRKVNYGDQTLFSFVFWPWNLKLLSAPVVDSIYLTKLGRRKTWVVSSLTFLGIIMYLLSYRINNLMGESEESGGHIDILAVTFIFFVVNFVVTLLDIALDGWAITILSKPHVGWAATCANVGQSVGYFMTSALFLSLESKDFCNKYLRVTPQQEGIVTLPGCLYFWSLFMLVSASCVLMFKKEVTDLTHDALNGGIISTYKKIIQVTKLPAIRRYLFLLLVGKIGFAATDALAGLKLIEAGMPKEKLALFHFPVIFIQIFLPLMLSKYTASPRPLNVWVWLYPIRILLSVLLTVIVWWAWFTQTTPGHFPWYFYLSAVTVYAFIKGATIGMGVSQSSFHAKISDPVIGGSYMTLLNAFLNIGGNWSSTLALWFVERLTERTCSTTGFPCGTDMLAAQVCTDKLGTCNIAHDGFYLETTVCIIIGILIYLHQKSRVTQLEQLEPSHWAVAH